MSGAGYHPDTYDLFQDDDAADVDYYLELAKRVGGPVLDLGAGTGRTVLPIARAGIAIDGLELDEAMASRLEDKLMAEPPEVRQRVRVHRGDMRQFVLPEEYRLVQIPFRSFLHNTTRDAQLSCLTSCFEHLVAGGTLAFNVFHPSLRYMSENHGALAGVWRHRGERSTPDGGRVIMSEATCYAPARQQLSSRLRYERFDAGGLLHSTRVLFLELAYLYPGDIREMLTATGFEDVHIHGDFDAGPFARDGDELVVTAIRP